MCLPAILPVTDKNCNLGVIALQSSKSLSVMTEIQLHCRKPVDSALTKLTDSGIAATAALTIQIFDFVFTELHLDGTKSEIDLRKYAFFGKTKLPASVPVKSAGHTIRMYRHYPSRLVPSHPSDH